jgi:hypothetical protein
MVTGYVPAGAGADVATVTVVDPEATTDGGLNEADAPDGSPVALKVTAPVKPAPGVTVAGTCTLPGHFRMRAMPTARSQPP